MWAYVFRRIVFNIPVYLTIVLVMMAALRVHDPVDAFLGKNPNPEDRIQKRQELGLDRAFLVQYFDFLGDVARLDFSVESWDHPGKEVGELLRESVVPSLCLTVPALVFTALISIVVGLISSFYRGRLLDRTLVTCAILGMSISFLVYIILIQNFVAGIDSGKTLAISGFDLDAPGRGLLGNWVYYCLVPVTISVIVAMGYDTRYYRAVMVEECNRDYITTAIAKGASKSKIMFVHMLKNAMIPIITRIMITLPFLITGSILLESYFRMPGMGNALITAISVKNFPVIQVFTAIFAAVFILSNILTDVLYALVDPRVRLS